MFKSSLSVVEQGRKLLVSRFSKDGSSAPSKDIAGARIGETNSSSTVCWVFQTSLRESLSADVNSARSTLSNDFSNMWLP